VFVIQVGSALTTNAGSVVALINGAKPSNVFWQIGSSATLGTSSFFSGTILALTSISIDSGVTLDGRALARNGAVTPADEPTPPPLPSFASLDRIETHFVNVGTETQPPVPRAAPLGRSVRPL